jgi:transposase
MRQKDRIAHLEAENAALRVELAAAYARLKRLEHRRAKDSHNSSQPPSRDGVAHQHRRPRKASEKKSGGQVGHAGHTLLPVTTPDEVISHRPLACQHCQQTLEGVPGEVKEHRQVHDLPTLHLVVRDHRVEQVQCPACQQISMGTFPAGVEAPVQYGPTVRALGVYLHQYQLVPLARTCELLADLYRCPLSQGTLASWVQRASRTLGPTVARIADLLIASPLQHGDETGVRVEGRGGWVHVNSTKWLTHLAWHPKRGRQALDAIGIWPRFRGRAMHDRWASYDRYACAHSVCGAHLLRDLTYVEEEEHQAWAGEMKDLLLSMHAAAAEWRQRGAACVPAEERVQWQARYFELLAAGFAAQAPPTSPDLPQRRGRRKQSAAKNLLDDLLRRAEQVLALVEDLRVPFTNNQAERDLRMLKVQQKIAGTFRSEGGAIAFCRIRSYLSTMRKQGHAMLAALAAVFVGDPLPIAWGT